MVSALSNYILQQSNAGYRIDQIETYLKSQGYPNTDVDNCVREALELSSKQYIGYIDQQARSGYKLTQIRSVLVQQGYDYKIVDYALNHYHKNFFKGLFSKHDERSQDVSDTDHGTKDADNSTYTQNSGSKSVSSEKKEYEKKIEQSIDQYVQQGLNQGLTLENLQSNLISQGYDSYLVSTEINKFRHSHLHIPKQIAAVFIAVIITGFLIGGILLILPNNSVPENMQERLLDVTASNAQPERELYPGDKLFIHTDLDIMGTEREFDIDFTYTILEGERVLRRDGATKASVSNLAHTMNLPRNMQAGTYTLQVEAEYQGETKARSFFEFEVIDDDEDSLGDDENREDISYGEIENDDGIDDESSQDDDKDIVKNTDDNNTKNNDIDDQQSEQSTTSSYDDVDDSAEFDANEVATQRYLKRSDRAKLVRTLEEKGQDQAFYTCDKIRNPNLETECRVFLIEYLDNPELCVDLEYGIKRDKCYITFAKESTDDSLCLDMSSRQTETICKIYLLRNKNEFVQDAQDSDVIRRVAEEFGTNST